MGCGSSSAGSDLRAQQQAQQGLTNQSVNSINNAFAGFNPQFYQNAQQAYTNFALPQVQDQYQTANQDLVYSLANKGLLNSGAANTERNALSADMNSAQQQVANQALTTGQNLQSQVSQEKANLIGQAQTATDPSAVAQQAIGAAAGIQAPSTFAPLGELFNNFATQYLGGQNASTYNNFSNQYLNSYSNPAIYGQNLYGYGAF